MPRKRFILVLASSAQEAAKYARRTGLKSGEYRAVAKASSIRGIQVADAHILPGFHKRPDRHAILKELRWARDVEHVDVEMPEPVEAPPKDQGDGMGEQLSLLDVLEEMPSQAELLERVPGGHKSVDPVIELFPAADSLAHVGPDAETAAEQEEPEQPKRKRRSRCKTCGRLTFAAYDVDREGHEVEAHRPGVFFQ